MKIIKTSLLAALLFCGTFSAEDAAGIISGKVKKNGAPLEGINIAALDTKKNTVSEALSDTEGKYELKELKPGLYTVKALPATETKLANQESIYTNVLAGKTTEVNFSLRNLKEETLVFPKGFDEKNTNQNLSFVKMVQLTVNDNKTTNEVKTGLRMHYPVGPAQGEAAEDGRAAFEDVVGRPGRGAQEVEFGAGAIEAGGQEQAGVVERHTVEEVA